MGGKRRLHLQTVYRLRYTICTRFRSSNALLLLVIPCQGGGKGRAGNGLERVVVASKNFYSPLLPHLALNRLHPKSAPAVFVNLIKRRIILIIFRAAIRVRGIIYTISEKSGETNLRNAIK